MQEVQPELIPSQMFNKARQMAESGDVQAMQAYVLMVLDERLLTLNHLLYHGNLRLTDIREAIADGVVRVLQSSRQNCGNCDCA